MNRHKNKNALILWNFLNNSSEIKKSDILWVLCSYNTEIADLAIKLYKDGLAGKILFSGAYGRGKSHYFLEPEARFFAAHAMEAGVPKEDIFIDDLATNAGESILLGYNHISKLKNKSTNVILIHKPYKLRATYNSILKQYPDIDNTKITPFSIIDDFEEYAEKFGEDRVINSMIKEVYKLKFYPDFGLMTKEEIPESVEVAYKYLISKGYNKELTRLIKKEKSISKPKRETLKKTKKTQNKITNMKLDKNEGKDVIKKVVKKDVKNI